MPSVQQSCARRRARVRVRQFAHECGAARRSCCSAYSSVYGSTHGAVLVEAAGRALDERAILQAGGENFAADGVGQRDVRTDVETEPAVGPLRARRAARIDDVEFRAVVNAVQDVMKEDRMRFARIRSPKNDDVGRARSPRTSWCRRPPRRPSSDRRRSGRVKFGCSYRCCCCRQPSERTFARR